MGRTLDLLDPIAEGIELDHDAALLTSLGRCCGQGNRFSAPVSAEAAAELLRRAALP